MDAKIKSFYGRVSGGGGSGNVYTTSWTSQTSVTVTHGLGSVTVLVQVFDTAGLLVEPEDIEITNSNVVTLTFGALFSGTVNIVANAGTLVIGGGSVTSVALTVPAWLTATGSPIVGAGTLAITGTSEPANEVLASPNGSAGPMAPRALVAADLPNIPESQVTGLVADLAALGGGVPATRTVNTTAPLTGGGALSADLTLAISTATTGALGVVKPDGTTITIASGVISAVGGAGTVTSVAVTVPADMAVSGSPIVGAGTIAITDTTQSANTFKRGPTSGSAATPTYGAIVPADLPVATTSALGAVKPDGTTITISAGVISAVGGGSGSLILLEQHTASSSAELDFTAWYSSSYDEYLIEVVNLIPATNTAAMNLQCSTTGGSSYDTTSGHYSWGGFFVVNTANANQGSSSDTRIALGQSLSNTTSAGGLSGSFRFYSPGSSSMNKLITGQTVSSSTGNGGAIAVQTVSGSYLITTAVDAFRVIASSGNIASGTVRVYGISH